MNGILCRWNGVIACLCVEGRVFVHVRSISVHVSTYVHICDHPCVLRCIPEHGCICALIYMHTQYLYLIVYVYAYIEEASSKPPWTLTPPTQLLLSPHPSRYKDEPTRQVSVARCNSFHDSPSTLSQRRWSLVPEFAQKERASPRQSRDQDQDQDQNQNRQMIYVPPYQGPNPEAVHPVHS